MAVNLTIELFEDDDDPTFGYWVDTSSAFDPSLYGYVHDGNNAFSGTLNAEGRYSLQLRVSDEGSGNGSSPVLHSVELGPLEDPTGDTELEVEVLNQNGQSIGGKGLVKLSTAVPNSRPIPKI